VQRALSVFIAVVVSGAVAAGVASGAAKSRPWQAVLGLSKTQAAACAKSTKANGTTGFSGYKAEKERRGQFSAGKKFEAEKSFSTQKAAKSEVAKLHKAGFKGASVENEKSEKGTAGTQVSCP
jgi:hypothetical protein